MSESIIERLDRWQLQVVRDRYPGLRIQPESGEGLMLAGDLHFRAIGPDGQEVEDCYQVELQIPSRFPMTTPLVRETGGRIARNYHKLKGGYLCLGAPTDLRIRLIQSPTLLSFIDEILVPYLYGHTCFQRHEKMPFGELEHGSDGLLQHFETLFSAPNRSSALEFVRLSALRRRHANKRICPCGKGRRLGRCCNRRVNYLRDLLGRRWFRYQLSEVDTPQ